MEGIASAWTGGKLEVVWQVLVAYLHLHQKASPSAKASLSAFFFSCLFSFLCSEVLVSS